MNICPVHCLRMETDAEGFLYPVADAEACIDCGLCEKVCPVLNAGEDIPADQSAYLLQYRNARVRRQSTSGGAFTAIAGYVLRQGGVVYGAAYDESLRVHHKAAESAGALAAFRGSKYVQSDTESTFSEVREHLNAGRLVCYSGTPCQIEGLLGFLQKPYEKLITVDVVCHAVPSPLVWERYLEMQGRKLGTRITDAKFREKHFGYQYSTMTLMDQDGQECYAQGIDTFVDQYRVDGTLPEGNEILPAGGFRKLRHSIGLVATSAAASMLCSHDKRKEFVKALWEAKHEPFEDGYFDAYYDGLLRLFAFMHLSGHYRIIFPPAMREMKTGHLSATIDTGAGGKILSLKYDDKEVISQSPMPEAFGSTFWTSPQNEWNWPPVQEFDKYPYEIERDGNPLVITSAVSPKLGLRIKKEFTTDDRSHALIVKYSIINAGTTARKVAPWEITRVPNEGLIFFDAPVDGITPAGLMSFTASDGAAWYQTDEARENRKVNADGKGWLAYLNNGLLLLKKFDDLSPTQPAPGEAEIQVYVNRGKTYIELESQGAYTNLAPGESLTWTVRWQLEPYNGTAPSKQLVKRTKKILKIKN